MCSLYQACLASSPAYSLTEITTSQNGRVGVVGEVERARGEREGGGLGGWVGMSERQVPAKLNCAMVVPIIRPQGLATAL